jgi:type II secretion system protein J
MMSVKAQNKKHLLYPKGVPQNSPGSATNGSATLGRSEMKYIPCKGYTTSRSNGSKSSRQGFTLLELVIATAIFSVLFAALYGVFTGALSLRERTYDIVEEGLPRSLIEDLIKKDLIHIALPEGTLSTEFIGTKDEAGAVRMDELEFYTTSGLIADAHPWGDMQRVTYYLAEAEDDFSRSTKDTGSDFVRTVTRNLLATIEEEPEEERLLKGVQGLEISYYDGEDWQESWDSTMMDNEMPLALRLRIDFVAPNGETRKTSPIEVVCAILPEAFESEDAGGSQT